MYLALTTGIIVFAASSFVTTGKPQTDDILHTGIATEVLLEYHDDIRTYQIFPHLNNKINIGPNLFHLQRFYVTPLLEVELNTIQYKLLREKPKLFSIVFRLKIYDDSMLERARQEIEKHFKNEGYQVMAYQVTPYIMPQMGIIFRDPTGATNNSLTIPHRIYPQISQSKNIWFELTVNDRKTAEDYVNSMKQNPELIFDMFVLKFSKKVGTTATKSIKVRIDAFKQTKVIAKVNNQLHAGDVFLSSDDMNDLIDQTSQAVRATEYVDGNYMENNDFISLKEIIDTTLKGEEATLKSFNDNRWKSTFWRKEWLKPDKTATFLRDNVIFNNKSKNNYYLNQSGIDTFDADEGSKSQMKALGTNVSTETVIKGVGITGGGGRLLNKSQTAAWLRAHSNTRFKMVNKSDLNHLLTSKNSHLQITGEKYKQHPLKLYRINTQDVHLQKVFDLAAIQVKEVNLVEKMELIANPAKRHLAALNLFANQKKKDKSKGNVESSESKIQTFVRYCNNPYGLCLPIWKDNKRENVYYYFPLLKVNTSSLEVQCTSVTGCSVRFPIIFFDDCYLIRVANYLSDINKTVIVHVENLEMYPMNKIKLVWAGDPVVGGIVLPKARHLSGRVKKTETFFLHAQSRQAADHFVKLFKSRPWSLTYLQLQYDVIARKTTSKTITVNFAKDAKTDFVSKLDNKKGSNEYYLNSKDYNKLCKEVAQKIVANQVTEGNFSMSSKNQVNLSDILRQIIHDKAVTADDTSAIWKSTFWEDSWTKPNVLKTFLKNVSAVGEGTNQTFSLKRDDINKYDQGHKANGKFIDLIITASGGPKIPGIFESTINTEHSKSTANQTTHNGTTTKNKTLLLNKDQLDSFIDITGNYIKWTGVKFTIKPLTLHRINKNKIKQDRTFVVQLRHGDDLGIQSTLSLNEMTPKEQLKCSDLHERTTTEKTTTTTSTTTRLATMTSSSTTTTTPTTTMATTHITTTTEKPFDFKILLFGGKSGDNSLRSIEYYSPRRPNKGRLAKQSMKIPRYGHISALLTKDTVIIAGGRRSLTDNNWPKASEIFHVETDEITDGGNINQVRFYASSIVIDGVAYMCGGRSFNGPLASCERYRSQAWKYIHPMTSKRAGLTMAVLNGHIYALGGYGLNTAEVYDPNTNIWTKINSMNKKRNDASATTLNGMIYICGGFEKGKQLESCEKYDSKEDKWSLDVKPLNTGRASFCLVAAAGHLVAMGGHGSIGLTAEVYDQRANNWTDLNPLIHNRDSSYAVVIE